MTIEQPKAAIAALSGTPELAEDNAAAVAPLQTALEAAEALAKDAEDDDAEEKGEENKIPEDETEEEKIERLVAERLAPMKANMDALDAKHKAQVKAAAQKEAEDKAAEISRLKEDGKIQEALEMELEAYKHKLSVATEETTRLSRDGTLDTVLSALDFRSMNARKMAKENLTGQLVQVDGVWQHKSGASIADAVESYANDKENKFLFKQKTNSGGGTDNVGDTKPDTGPKTPDILEMTTEQMLQAAADGKLGTLNF